MRLSRWLPDWWELSGGVRWSGLQLLGEAMPACLHQLAQQLLEQDWRSVRWCSYL